MMKTTKTMKKTRTTTTRSRFALRLTLLAALVAATLAASEPTSASTSRSDTGTTGAGANIAGAANARAQTPSAKASPQSVVEQRPQERTATAPRSALAGDGRGGGTSVATRPSSGVSTPATSTTTAADADATVSRAWTPSFLGYWGPSGNLIGPPWFGLGWDRTSTIPLPFRLSGLYSPLCPLWGVVGRFPFHLFHVQRHESSNQPVTEHRNIFIVHFMW